MKVQYMEIHRTNINIKFLLVMFHIRMFLYFFFAASATTITTNAVTTATITAVVPVLTYSSTNTYTL